jgi:hypothetical protein
MSSFIGFSDENAISAINLQRALGQTLVRARALVSSALNEADQSSVANQIEMAFERSDISYQLVSNTLEAVRNSVPMSLVDVNVKGRSIQQQTTASVMSGFGNVAPLVASDAIADEAERIWNVAQGLDPATRSLTEEQRQFLATFDDDRYPNDPNADLSAIISTIPPEARAFLSDLRKFLDEGGGDALKGISALRPTSVLGSPYAGLGSTGSNDAGNAGTSVAAVSGAKLGGLGSTSSTHDLNDCGIGRTDVEKVLDWYLNESPNAKFVDGAIGRGRAERAVDWYLIDSPYARIVEGFFGDGAAEKAVDWYLNDSPNARIVDAVFGDGRAERAVDWYLNDSPNAKIVEGIVGGGRVVAGLARDAVDSVVDSAQAFGSWYVDRYTAIGSNVSAMAGAGYDAAGDAVHAFGETVADSVSFVGDSVSEVGDTISDVGRVLKGFLD